MGTDRKIKSDGQVHIESTNVDIDSTVDITGDVNATGDIGGATSTITGNASVGGDLTVTGDTSTTDLAASGTGSFTGNLSVSSINNLTFPSADGTADQALVTNGSGVLSFADVASGGGGGGVDTITSATEAANYSGTNRIVHITATEAVTFTNDFKDRIIFMKEEYNITFQDCDVENCVIQSFDKIIFETTATDGTTDMNLIGNNVNAYGNIEYKDTGNTIGNTIRTMHNSYRCGDFFATNMDNNSFSLLYTSLDCFRFYATGTNTDQQLIVGSGSIVNCHEAYGNIQVWYGQLNCGSGADSPNNLKLFIGAGNITTASMDSVYPIGFRATSTKIESNVLVQAYASAQAITSTSATTLTSFTEEFDTTNDFNASTGVFTASVDGKYAITYQGSIGNIASDSYVYVRLRAANSILSNFAFGVEQHDRGGDLSVLVPYKVVDLVMGETIYVEADSESDAIYTITTDNFTITKIG